VSVEDQVDILRLLLEEQGSSVWVDRGVRDAPNHRVLLIFVNADVLEVPSARLAAQQALAANTRILLVHEKDGRHGACLNEDGGVDFQAITKGAPQVCNQALYFVLIY